MAKSLHLDSSVALPPLRLFARSAITSALVGITRLFHVPMGLVSRSVAISDGVGQPKHRLDHSERIYAAANSGLWGDIGVMATVVEALEAAERSDLERDHR